jgi:hypothetical protein
MIFYYFIIIKLFMKKILFIILLLGLSVPVHAQMEYGIIGGINFGYFNEVPPLGDAVSSFGYMLGVRGSLGSNLFLNLLSNMLLMEAR